MPDKADFVKFLTTDPDIAKINFKFLSYTVYPTGYSGDIANCINAGHIGITRRFSDLGYDDTGGSYIPGDNKYSLSRSFDLTKVFYQIILVHESTHALQDYQRLGSVSRAEAEAVAYVAEAVYVQAKGYSPIKDPKTHLPDPIRAAADTVATAILGGSYLVPPHLAAVVTSAVKTSPHYGSLPPLLSFNGVG